VKKTLAARHPAAKNKKVKLAAKVKKKKQVKKKQKA